MNNSCLICKHNESRVWMSYVTYTSELWSTHMSDLWVTHICGHNSLVYVTHMSKLRASHLFMTHMYMVTTLTSHISVPCEWVMTMYMSEPYVTHVSELRASHLWVTHICGHDSYFTHMSALQMSHEHIHEWVVCHTYEWVTGEPLISDSYIYGHDSYLTQTSDLQASHLLGTHICRRTLTSHIWVTCEWAMTTHMSESWHTYEWVMYE